MEKLKRKKVVFEKKGYGKGVYFLRSQGMKELVEECLSPVLHRNAARKLIDFYRQSPDTNENTIITLAEQHLRMRNIGDGLGYIKDAADLLHGMRDNEKALAYYDYLIDYVTKNGPTEANVDTYLDSVITRVAAMERIFSDRGRLALLSRAEEAERQFNRTGYLTLLKIALAQELLVAKQPAKASRYFIDFCRLVENNRDPKILRRGIYWYCWYLFWKGRLSEIVRYYEEAIGNLEEFGDDDTSLATALLVAYCCAICGRIARGMGMVDAVRAKAKLIGSESMACLVDFMTVLFLFEIRKVSNAEFFLDRLSAFPDNKVNRRVQREANECRAYILCIKGDYEGAFEHHKKSVEVSRSLKWNHHFTPWTFEYLAILESKGLVHKKTNYDSEIKRLLPWDDIRAKGVALRYRALRNMEKNRSPVRVLQDLKKSEKYLKKAGAQVELARTQIALGRYYLKKDGVRAARPYLEKAWVFFSVVDKNLVPNDLLAIMPQEQKVESMIDRITQINESLGAIRDRPSFLERVINVAMGFTMATRGAFLTHEANSDFRIIASRNIDPLLFNSEKFKHIKNFLLEAMTESRELIVSDMQDEKKIGLREALRERGVSSLIHMPARLGECTHGYLYLDNMLGGNPFRDNYLPYVRLLCNLIAVGLFNIGTYEEMRGLKDRFEEEALFYKREMGVAAPIEMMVGESEGIRKITDQVRQVAPMDTSVLVLGETGVGKELVAKAIHNLSKRNDGPFILVNLAALPQELVASELFGHERGAFMGANERHKGRFELADGGTIFLDEIGDLPVSVQVKLLRVLEEGAFERLGSTKRIRSNFRIVAATNKNLFAEVERGNFRQDLYYRLCAFPIHVPPLRERKEDIPLIAHHFLDKLGKKADRRIGNIPASEMKKLLDYDWPGNVRELEHFIERAVILSNGNGVTFSGVREIQAHRAPTEDGTASSLSDMKRQHIQKVLKATRWKVYGLGGAAKLLGLKPTTLLYRMKILDIKRPSYS
jgi:transcriptional regulator with GAF, ATPase, and Fis domain/tetratricopeptide (TPR) repeat protein